MSAVVPKKERKPTAPYTSPLPPCKICGAKASGLHYGVNTCEACKGFFRRAIKFQRKYRCFQQQDCDVTGGRSIRTSCPFCRLQKCLNMGMAHEAIKTGRYTHAKRTENIMEVKRLENVHRKSNFGHGPDVNTHLNVEPCSSSTYGQPFLLVHGQQFFKMERPSDDFWNTPIKQEFPDEFHSGSPDNSVWELESPQYKMATLDHYSIQNNIHSDDFKNKLTKVIFQETRIQLNHDFPIAIENDSKASNDPPGDILKENMNKNLCLDTDNSSEVPSSMSSQVTEIIEGPVPGSVFISIPTPPLSSGPSSEDSDFDFSMVDQSQVVVISPESSSALVISSDSYVSPPNLLSPTTTPSYDHAYCPFASYSSPCSSCSSFPFSSASSSTSFMSGLVSSSCQSPPLPSMSQNGQQCQKNISKLFSDLSQFLDRDLTAFVEVLLINHRKNVLTLKHYDEAFIRQVQNKYIDKLKVRAEVFGLNSLYLKDETYKEIFHQTGLDVDGRQETRLKASFYFSTYFHTLMKFAISIPGFTSLLPHDQYTLIASAICNQWFLNAYPGINKNQAIILMPNLQVYSAREISWLLGPHFVEKCFDFALHFQKLNLSYEVLVLWKVVVLLSTDHGNLVEPDKITQLQSIYVNCLCKLTNRRKGEKTGLFARLISLTVLIRELDHTRMTPPLLNTTTFHEKAKQLYLEACSC